MAARKSCSGDRPHEAKGLYAQSRGRDSAAPTVGLGTSFLGLGIFLAVALLHGCTKTADTNGGASEGGAWTDRDREAWVWDCAVVRDRQSRGRADGTVTRTYCTCLLTETESRYSPEQAKGNFTTMIGELPQAAVTTCKQKAGL